MSDFKTYRVRCQEWQTLAITVSARSADNACELARQIRSDVGQEPFEEIDGAIENFEAEEEDVGATPAQFTRALDDLVEAASALDAAMDGATDGSREEVAHLRRALKKAAPVRAFGKGTVPDAPSALDLIRGKGGVS
jgi:hypothetical protein